MTNGDNVIQPDSARIDVARVVNEIYSELPAVQRQLLADAIRLEFRQQAAEHEARRISQTIEAIAEISPEIARQIESLPTPTQQEKGLDVVAAIAELVSALTNLYNAPPAPQLITRIVINVEGPDVQAIIVPPSQPEPPGQ